MVPDDFDREDWVPAADVVARDVTDGAMLLDMKSGRCWQINATGTALWRSLSSATSLAAAIEGVARTFGDGRERVEADMKQFAKELVEAGILVRRPPGARPT